MQKRDVVVVGAGAAGVFAALELRRRSPQTSVTVLEAAQRPLSKVKISGGGRCNVTHACFEISALLAHYPRGQKQLRSILQRFGPAQTMEWFEQRGVALKVEPDGRVFPVSDSSQSIIDCLLQQAQILGVELCTGAAIKELNTGEDGNFLLQGPQGDWQASQMLLATGSSPLSYGWLRRLGHSIVPPVPSLFTFTIADPRLEGLAGVSPRAPVRATLALDPKIVQEGPLLITHWGLSGPVILRLSAWGARPLAEHNYQASLLVDWLPQMDQEKLRQKLLHYKRDHGRRPFASEPPAELPKRLWRSLLGPDSDLPAGQVSDKTLGRWSEMLKRCPFAITAKGVFKEEFVVAGGVPLAEVDLKTMASRKCPGLYLAGELLDVDGLTGGFNFQNAWATGWLAGSSLAGG